MLLLFPLLALPRAAAAFAPPPPSQQFGFGRTIGGAISDWPLGAGVELQAWAHNVTTPAGREHGAYLHHFWSAGGKGAVGQYCADHQTIRYYVDGETKPSIEFTPAMAAGSGVGWEGLGYYNEGRNAKEAWGPTMSNDLCGPTPPSCPERASRAGRRTASDRSASPPPAPPPPLPSPARSAPRARARRALGECITPISQHAIARSSVGSAYPWLRPAAGPCSRSAGTPERSPADGPASSGPCPSASSRPASLGHSQRPHPRPFQSLRRPCQRRVRCRCPQPPAPGPRPESCTPAQTIANPQAPSSS